MAGNDYPLWTLPPEDVLRALESSAGGLTPTEAQRRLLHYGRNELPEPPQRPLWLRFVDQLTHFMALLLWVAGILAFVARTPELGWAILNHHATPEVMAVYAQATTMTLAVIVACQIGNLFACRSDHRSVFQLNWAGNRLLWLGILVECLVLLACIYVPVLSRVFQTAPLAGWQWLLLPLCPLILLGAEELRKLLLRRRRVVRRGSS